LLYAVTGALGFSTVENFGYTMQVTGIDVLWTALQRIALSTPLHLTCAYLIGVGVVKRDVGFNPVSVFLSSMLLLYIIDNGFGIVVF
jgi:RsiW-degrading membrane proteinase PrsW (M82 family)